MTDMPKPLEKILDAGREVTASDVSAHYKRAGVIMGESIAADWMMTLVENGELVTDWIGSTKIWRRGEEGQRQSLRRVVEETAERHGYTVLDLRGPTRSATLAKVRLEIMKKARALGFSSVEIGRALNRNPSTVRSRLNDHQKRQAG